MDRKAILTKNISQSLIFKILNLGLVFLTIPLLLNYLEEEQYGLWATLFSIINMIFFLDMGVGNGLKTKLTEALSLDKKELAKEYISNTYFFVIIVACGIFLIGSIIILNIDLKDFLNASNSKEELTMIFLITLFLVCAALVINLFKALFYSIQEASKVELSLLIYQLAVLLTVIFALNYLPSSLLTVSLIYCFMNIIIGSLFTILFFFRYKYLTPSILYVRRQKINKILGLSLEFFVIQLCMIVIFTSDNLIITRLLGPEEVTKYDIANKFFQVIITLAVIGQAPFWAIFTDAYQKKHFAWIKNTIMNLNKLFIPFTLLMSVIIFVAKPAIGIWLGRDLGIPQILIYLMSLFVLIRVYGTIYMSFLNGIGDVKIQMWCYILGAVINIPLSIVFANYYGLGISGVILGTIVSLGVLTLVLPIQTFYILRRHESSKVH